MVGTEWKEQRGPQKEVPQGLGRAYLEWLCNFYNWSPVELGALASWVPSEWHTGVKSGGLAYCTVCSQQRRRGARARCLRPKLREGELHQLSSIEFRELIVGRDSEANRR